MRDRLIELLTPSIADVVENRKGITELADYLIANGVIVPPCKVGEIVWIKDYERYPKIQEAEIIGIIKNKYGAFIRYEYLAFRGREYVRSIEYIGKTVFLTKEEAEQALKGGEG